MPGESLELSRRVGGVAGHAQGIAMEMMLIMRLQACSIIAFAA
jgi:hypothetical protein